MSHFDSTPMDAFSFIFIIDNYSFQASSTVDWLLKNMSIYATDNRLETSTNVTQIISE